MRSAARLLGGVFIRGLVSSDANTSLHAAECLSALQLLTCDVAVSPLMPPGPPAVLTRGCTSRKAAVGRSSCVTLGGAVGGRE